MKGLLCKFCDYACRVDGGKGSLIGMFDTIGGMEFPLTHPTFFICVEFEFQHWETNKDTQVKMVLIDEDGKELMGVEGHFRVPPSHDGRPVTIFESFRIDNLRFDKPGIYRLDVISNNEPIAESRLYLVSGPPPGAMPGHGPRPDL